MPVFTFLLVEGFRNTSDFKKYFLSVLLFAAVSEIPYDRAVNGKLFDFSDQNAMLSMAICLLMLYFLNLVKSRTGLAGTFFKAAIVAASVVWAALFRTEYGLCLVLLTAIFYIFYTRYPLHLLVLALAAKILLL